jgi:hypothetical protein
MTIDQLQLSHFSTDNKGAASTLNELLKNIDQYLMIIETVENPALATIAPTPFSHPRIIR